MAQARAARERQVRRWSIAAVLLVTVAVIAGVSYKAYKELHQADAKDDQIAELVGAVESLNGVVESMQSEIDSLTGVQQVQAERIAAAIAAPPIVEPVSVSVPVQQLGFQRDESIPLADQANNPGALNLGDRARRYGATESFAGTPGQNTAIFTNRVYGIAALINLLRQFDGIILQNYLCGGGAVKSWKSYTGGDPERCKWFLQVFEDQIGLKPFVPIDINNIDMIQDMVRVHQHAEGSRVEITDDEWRDAFALEQSVQ